MNPDTRLLRDSILIQVFCPSCNNTSLDDQGVVDSLIFFASAKVVLCMVACNCQFVCKVTLKVWRDFDEIFGKSRPCHRNR